MFIVIKSSVIAFCLLVLLTNTSLRCVQVCGLVWSEEHKELISGHGYANNELVIWKYPTMTRVAELTGRGLLLATSIYSLLFYLLNYISVYSIMLLCCLQVTLREFWTWHCRLMVRRLCRPQPMKRCGCGNVLLPTHNRKNWHRLVHLRKLASWLAVLDNYIDVGLHSVTRDACYVNVPFSLLTFMMCTVFYVHVNYLFLNVKQCFCT